MLSQTKSGFIVESLLDGKRFPVFAHERVSSLEEISIFSSTEEDIPLKEIFKKIFDKTEGKAAIDPKSGTDKLKEFFTVAVPEHDQERVYPSDIKKVLGWYNLLLAKEMMTFEEEEEKEEQVEEQKDPEPKEKKKTSAKKSENKATEE